MAETAAAIAIGSLASMGVSEAYKAIKEPFARAKAEKEFKEKQAKGLEDLDMMTNKRKSMYNDKLSKIANILMNKKGHHSLGLSIGGDKKGRWNTKTKVARMEDVRKMVYEAMIESGSSIDDNKYAIVQRIVENAGVSTKLKRQMQNKVPTLKQGDTVDEQLKLQEANRDFKKSGTKIDNDDLLSVAKKEFQGYDNFDAKKKEEILRQLSAIYSTSYNDQSVEGRSELESKAKAVDDVRKEINRMKQKQDLIGLSDEKTVEEFAKHQLSESTKDERDAIDGFINHMTTNTEEERKAFTRVRPEQRPLSKEQKQQVIENLRDLSYKRYVNKGGSNEEAQQFANEIAQQVNQLTKENEGAKQHPSTAFLNAVKSANSKSLNTTNELSGIYGTTDERLASGAMKKTISPFEEVVIEGEIDPTGQGVRRTQRERGEATGVLEDGLQKKSIQIPPQTNANAGRWAPDVEVGGYDDLVPELTEQEYANMKFNAFDHVYRYPYINTQDNPIFIKDRMRERRINAMGHIDPTNMNPYRENDPYGQVRVLPRRHNGKYQMREAPQKYTQGYKNANNRVFMGQYVQYPMQDRTVDEPYSRELTRPNPPYLNQTRKLMESRGLYQPEIAYRRFNESGYGKTNEPNYRTYQRSDQVMAEKLDIDDITFLTAMRR